LLTIVAKGRMAQVMSQADRFNEVLTVTDVVDDSDPVASRRAARNASTDLSALKRVGQSSPKEVACFGSDDLALALKPTQRSAVNDPISVFRDGRSRAGFN
jgi:hypothetical protein